MRQSSDCGVALARDGVSGFSVAQRLSQSLEGPVFDQAFVKCEPELIQLAIMILKYVEFCVLLSFSKKTLFLFFKPQNSLHHLIC